jgi:hypothetical protein
VHADYFFENILWRDGKITGLLDFGDSYCGCLLTDVVVGAMEFAVDESENWHFGHMRSFLQPLGMWLSKASVDGELCLKLLAANCVRFAAYTARLTQSKGQPVASNPYVRRFKKMLEPEFSLELTEVFEEAIQGSTN